MTVFQTKPSQKPHKNFCAYYRKDLTRIRYKRRKPPAVTIYRGNFAPKKFTGKEQDQETGLYYFGARYLDPKTSRWLSTDPALGDYLPVAPNGDDEKKHNQNLPGMGGVFNIVNLHVYHYAGNNPVKYVDPDGNENKAALKFMQEHMTGIPFGPGYQQRPDGTWPLAIPGVENLPKELYCYEAVFLAYRNSGVSKELPGARVPAFEWFQKGGTVNVNGNTMKKTLETDITKGQVGDIVFMGEHREMEGHSVLLEKIDRVDDNTMILTTFGANVPENNNTIGREEHTFKKIQGKWINTSHGNYNYEFRGYGQLSEN